MRKQGAHTGSHIKNLRRVSEWELVQESDRSRFQYWSPKIPIRKRIPVVVASDRVGGTSGRRRRLFVHEEATCTTQLVGPPRKAAMRRQESSPAAVSASIVPP